MGEGGSPGRLPAGPGGRFASRSRGARAGAASGLPASCTALQRGPRAVRVPGVGVGALGGLRGRPTEGGTGAHPEARGRREG